MPRQSQMPASLQGLDGPPMETGGEWGPMSFWGHSQQPRGHRLYDPETGQWVVVGPAEGVQTQMPRTMGTVDAGSVNVPDVPSSRSRRPWGLG
jgi:hypothetical protein